MPIGRVERLTRVQPVDIGIFHRLDPFFSTNMLQLAIECSAIHGSIVVCDSRPCADSIALPTDKSSVQSLAQTVKTALAGRKPSFISLTNGPGSFTGLRVGIATVKMLALAWNVPIVAVDTLQVLACQIAAQHAVNRQSVADAFMVVPVINAFRRQVFTSVWLAGSNGTVFPLTDSNVVDADVWLESPVAGAVVDNSRPPVSPSISLSASSFWASDSVSSVSAVQPVGLPSRILVGGPGLESYRPQLLNCQFQSKLGLEAAVPVEIFPGIIPDAKWVAEVGFQRFQAGLCESADSLLANYVRASAAEEKLRS